MMMMMLMIMLLLLLLMMMVVVVVVVVLGIVCLLSDEGRHVNSGFFSVFFSGPPHPLQQDHTRCMC